MIDTSPTSFKIVSKSTYKNSSVYKWLLSRRTEVKRIFTLNTASKGLLLIFLTSSLVSCSMFSHRALLGEDAKKGSAPKNMVPREQYDALLKKYEALVNDKQIAAAKTNKKVDLNRPEILDALSNAQEPALAETVNVFDETAMAKMPVAKGVSKIAPQIDVELNPDAIEKEIGLIREAQEFVVQNKFNNAMENLKALEKSPVKQIRVNAKFLVGEILFKQQEYDLALQVFEEIITQNAFSGVVIKSLGRLIVCAEKLKLAEKQQRYHSLLHDFFEA